MTSQTFLDAVYHLSTPAQTQAMYDNWSASYDDEITQNGYATPFRVAEALSRHLPDTDASLLDFGCGTGLSGAALTQFGFSTIDGVDLSSEMLEQARAKQIYRKLWQVDPDPVLPQGYRAIIATGVIGVGAAPAEVFDVIMQALAPGGLFVLSFNDHALADPRFEGRLRHHTDTGKARLLFQEYGAHLPGINLNSNVYVLEKL